LWKEPLTVSELKAWLGLLITMGIHQLPQIGVPAFASITTTDPFLVILRYLHFSDNEAMPPRGDTAFDKLYKVRPLVKALKQRFQQQYSPHTYDRFKYE